MIIKFSHLYFKMPRDYQLSKLLDVIPIKLEELSKDFREYDTTFQQVGGLTVCYPLPDKGNYMLLLLQAGSGKGHLWTTIRSQWGKSGNKLEYYRKHIGEVCECKVIS